MERAVPSGLMVDKIVFIPQLCKQRAPESLIFSADVSILE
jgi:hypothetical protein